MSTSTLFEGLIIECNCHLRNILQRWQPIGPTSRPAVYIHRLRLTLVYTDLWVFKDYPMCRELRGWGSSTNTIIRHGRKPSAYGKTRIALPFVNIPLTRLILAPMTGHRHRITFIPLTKTTSLRLQRLKSISDLLESKR